MWPGFFTSLAAFEGGDLMLQVDVTFRLLRTETVLDFIRNLLYAYPALFTLLDTNHTRCSWWCHVFLEPTRREAVDNLATIVNSSNASFSVRPSGPATTTSATGLTTSTLTQPLAARSNTSVNKLRMPTTTSKLLQ